MARPLLQGGAVEAPPQPEVLVVSQNPETRDELGAYLRGAGLAVGSTADLAEALRSGARRAVVLFPDEFALEEARTTIATLRRSSPSTRIVVVTAADRVLFPHPAERADRVVVVLTRPAFGWNILDAVRGDDPAGATS